jgi:para-aminobenzoate synthetase component 1
LPIEFVQKLNDFGRLRRPFFFVVDYKGEQGFVQPLDALDDDIFYVFPTARNVTENLTCKVFLRQKTFPNREAYRHKVNAVHEEIRSGNTYLLNLSAPTDVVLDTEDLRFVFNAANAPFKLYFKDRFVCFSPERFVKIEDNRIFTYPMKGTIAADVANAQEVILNDEKEKAEHVMVVDLLRNDLSMVASQVRVDRFRYVEKIQAGEKELLQVSSQISGYVDESWHEKIGSMLSTMLPAGSISGTPKRKSVEIIERLEGYKRGFFTGVFGIYDGERFDSAVLIRFLEKSDEGFVFKSGGGITLLSDADKEYEEVCDKVYIPVF